MKSSANYVTRISTDWLAVDRAAWNDLLSCQTEPTPFMRWEYLHALQASGSATPETGWDLRIVTLWSDTSSKAQLVAACALYLKPHSYGEYVFDQSWANAYAQHGLDYYPKAVIAVPFTPVPGTRLLARHDTAKATLIMACQQLCDTEHLSSLHLLFTSKADQAACTDGAAAMMPRHTMQFHWTNRHAHAQATPYTDFDDFLATLAHDKRKKIKQERRKVLDEQQGAGITFRHAQGHAISAADWDFFYTCYEQTYFEHGNAPYLTRDFFRRMATDMPSDWLLFIAQLAGQPIASSLMAIQEHTHTHAADGSTWTEKVAYGRYWGAIMRVDCLHFETCYYQPIQWCIANGYHRFEGGAQGEHKMARALLPVTSTSMHHIQHPQFAKAIERFLERERAGVAHYLADLMERSPVKR